MFQHQGGIERLDVYQTDNLDNFVHLWSYSKTSESDEWISGQVQILAEQNPAYEYRVRTYWSISLYTTLSSISKMNYLPKANTI